MNPSSSPSAEAVNALKTLFNDGRFSEAATAAETMTRHFPGHFYGWMVLGTALRQLGRTADALAAMQKAADLAPQNAQALNNLAATLRDLRRFEKAVACSRQALAIRPDFPEAHLNLANSLADLRQFEGAVASYHQALQIRPDYALALTNLGATLTKLGRLGEAAAACRRAVEINPDYFGAHINLGIALQDLGQLNESVASHRRAIELKPDSAEAHNNLGSALLDLGQFAEASTNIRRALELSPDLPFAHNNLAKYQKEIGRIDEAVVSWRRAFDLQPDYFEMLDAILFARSYQPGQRAAAVFDEARRYGELVGRAARPYSDWPNPPESNRSLRVGLVSGDFGNHPIGYFLENLLAIFASDSSRGLEFFGYPSYPRSGPIAERIKASCRHWRPVTGHSDERLARQIRDDGIDILVDLSGHTAHNRLPMFAWRPAPVQMSWLGYLATTGVAAINYLVADPWTLPESEAPNFTEKIWRLPETYLCFSPPDADLPVSAPPALATGCITFGSFNNLAKMNDEVVALWARILLAVPRSRLFLKTLQLEQRSSRAEVARRFAAHGIDGERLTMEGRSPRPELLSTYRHVDIALDPFPYPGITTTIEALWMGVPVLTMAGRSFLSRQGVGLLTNVGLPEWITTDPDDYVAKAVTHAGDLQNLGELRSKLRQTLLTSPLLDARRFADNFQAALRGMWTRWCNERPGTGAPAGT